MTSAALSDYSYDFFSQALSEGNTRGILGWLRSTGYPRNERAIYQHSWIDLESIDEKSLTMRHRMWKSTGAQRKGTWKVGLIVSDAGSEYVKIVK
ncbi:hypothetical protein PHISCL_05031 [Aspergillus sclerotialis]|uniref:Uncharacterized protein n=1 Tax=Aspergillus sclerotialis TaxID=2070753 RepID=A0A3A2ZHF4_9EURO|nr:hypothetical protein PHISCL_05031 [Aspergillus sclerotialis]